jgi:ribosomal protein L17
MTLPKRRLRKFGKRTVHRRLMFKNLTASLILNGIFVFFDFSYPSGQITTTLEKAKELRRFAERMITLSKKGTPTSKKQAASFLNNNEEAVNTLFREYCTRYHSILTFQCLNSYPIKY